MTMKTIEEEAISTLIDLSDSHFYELSNQNVHDKSVPDEVKDFQDRHDLYLKENDDNLSVTSSKNDEDSNIISCEKHIMEVDDSCKAKFEMSIGLDVRKLTVTRKSCGIIMGLNFASFALYEKKIVETQVTKFVSKQSSRNRV